MAAATASPVMPEEIYPSSHVGFDSKPCLPLDALVSRVLSRCLPSSVVMK
jgi:hypothetical protein